MAAIAYPRWSEVEAPRRPHLRLVEPVAPRRSAQRRGPSTRCRRRRAAVATTGGLVVAMRLVLGGLGGGPLTASEPAPHPQPPALAATAAVVAQPGDSLWTMVRRSHPTGDIRPIVDRLVAERHGTPLHVGEAVVVP